MKRRVYLDYAAATPLDPSVRRAMEKATHTRWANPGSLHVEGRLAQQTLSEARLVVAQGLYARPSEITFTAGGTESCALALKGATEAYWHTHPHGPVPEVIATNIEHASVRNTLLSLKEKGKIILREIPVNEEGSFDTRVLRELLSPQTFLVSVMLINNEIGTRLPVEEVAKELRHWKKEHGKKDDVYPLVHTDASQVFMYEDIDVRKLGADMMSLSSAKVFGPGHGGVLWKKESVPLVPLITGGNQEKGLRSGTPDIATIVGCAAALSKAADLREKSRLWVQELRNYAVALAHELPSVRVLGGTDTAAPHIIALAVDGASGERLVIELDAFGYAVASQSACGTDTNERSHVAEALDLKRSEGMLRISLAPCVSRKEIRGCMQALKEVLEKIAYEKTLTHG